MWRVWIGSAGVLAVVGWLIWYIPYQQTGYTETAGTLPLMMATVPTVMAAVIIRVSHVKSVSGRPWIYVARLLLAAIACSVGSFVAFILGNYLLPSILPHPLSCCPL